MLNITKYIMNQLFTPKNEIIPKLNLFLISVLPIGLVAGSLISNLIVILIGILFITEISIKKKFNYLNKRNFYFLILINIYLILNSYFISENEESTVKAIGFIRFILMAYAISYYFDKFDKKILKFWFLFFLIVTLDLLFEYTFGKNILGNETTYPGRLAGFTGDELKIGGFYFGFIFLSLSFLINRKYRLFYLFSIIFFIVSILIGERSNFIKIFCMYLIFFIFYFNISFIKKSLIIIILFIFSFTLISQIPILKSKFVNHIFNENLTSYFKMEEEIKLIDVLNTNQHFSHYYVAIKIFKENPIFGTGFKSFRLESHKDEYKKDVFGSSTHPHQFHFEILSELGIVGYVLIMLNLFIVVYRQFQFNNNNYLSKFASIFIVVSLIPMLPSGSFFTSFGATIFFVNYSFLIRPK